MRSLSSYLCFCSLQLDEAAFIFWQDAYRLQLKLFLYEVKQQQLLSGVRTYLKVYSTICVGKLATYLEVDEPTLRSGIIRILMSLNVGKMLYAHLTCYNGSIDLQENSNDLQAQGTCCWLGWGCCFQC